MSRRRITICGIAVAICVVSAASSQEAETVTLDRSQVSTLLEPQWTVESRAAAIPMPLLERAGEPYLPPFWVPPGEPGGVPGTLPGQTGGAAVTVESTGLTAAGRDKSVTPTVFGGTDWYGYPPPHNLQPGFALSTYPHTTLGKLFFTDGVDNFVCSGAVVTCPGDKDLVMTAGHCCSDGAGNFFQGYLFVPGCRGPGCSVAPFGTWDWESVTVLNDWHLSGDFSRDVCWLKVKPNAMMQQIQDVTGALGMAWNLAEPHFHVQTGWPAEAPFNGQRLWLEYSSTADLDGSESPATLGKGSLMTRGSSGGAWIFKHRLNVTNENFNRWNGLNSYKYAMSRPKEMYGPYIDTTIRNTTVGGIVNCP